MPVAAFKWCLQWTDPDGQIMTTPQKTVSIPYTLCLEGVANVPAGAVSGSEIDIVLPGFTQLTGFVFENETGQELGTAWTGQFAPSVAPGGADIFLDPVQISNSGRMINGWRFFLTQNQPSPSPGGLRFWALGY